MNFPSLTILYHFLNLFLYGWGQCFCFDHGSFRSTSDRPAGDNKKQPTHCIRVFYLEWKICHYLFIYFFFFKRVPKLWNNFPVKLYLLEVAFESVGRSYPDAYLNGRHDDCMWLFYRFLFLFSIAFVWPLYCATHWSTSSCV